MKQIEKIENLDYQLNAVGAYLTNFKKIFFFYVSVDTKLLLPLNHIHKKYSLLLSKCNRQVILVI